MMTTPSMSRDRLTFNSVSIRLNPGGVKLTSVRRVKRPVVQRLQFSPGSSPDFPLK